MPGCEEHLQLSESQMLDNAKAFANADNARVYAIELKNTLQHYPDNLEARWLLGNHYLKSHDGEAAEKELRMAMNLGMSPASVMPALAEALNQQRKYRKLLSETSDFQGLPDRDKTKVLVYRGDAFLGLKDADNAEKAYQAALKLSVGGGWPQVGMGRLKLMQRKPEEARQWIEKALELDPELGMAWSFLGYLEQQEGQLEAAEQAYSKAIELRRFNIVEYAMRALVRITLDKREAAESDAAHLSEKAADYHLTHFVKGMLDLESGAFNQAQTAFEQTLNSNTEYVEAMFYLGMSHLKQDHIEQANDLLMRFLNSNPDSIAAHRMLALIRYRENKYSESSTYLEKILRHLPEDNFSLSLKSQIALATGQADQGLPLLQKLAKEQPDSARVQAQLAAGMFATGQSDKGLEALRNAIALDPDFLDAKTFLITSHIRQGKLAEARLQISELKAAHPDSAVPHVMAGALLLTEKKPEQAQQSFEKALKIDPNNVKAHKYLGGLALKAEQVDKAIRHYRTALERGDTALSTRITLARIYSSQKDLKTLETLLLDTIQGFPEAYSVRLMLARLYLQSRQAEKALELLEPVRTVQAKNVEFLTSLTEAYLLSGKGAEAEETAKRLTQLEPNAAKSHYLLSQAYGARQNTRDMKAALEKAIKTDPAFLPAQISLTKILLLEKDIPAAEKLLRNVQRRFPDRIDAFNLTVWVAMQRGDTQLAEKTYQSALEKHPTESFVIRLAKLQWEMDKKTAALETLSNWLDKQPANVTVRYLRANFLSTLNRHEEEIEELKTILDIKPNDTLVLNNIAWALRDSDPEAALGYANRAALKAPKSASILDTQGLLLLKTGQAERALDVLDTAHSLQRDNPTIRYHLALAMLENGRNKAAQDMLEDLVQSETDFKAKTEAKERLLKLKAGH